MTGVWESTSAGSVALVVASAISGLGAYGYVLIGTRTYGSSEFAPIAILWTIWALAVAVLTFPIQHWIIRTITSDGHEGGVRVSIVRIAAASIAVALVVTVVSWILRGDLFGRRDAFFPALSGLVTLAAAVLGVARGLLSGRRAFWATSVLIAGESVVRLAAAAFVVTLGFALEAYAAAVLAGVVVAAVFPTSLVARPTKARERPSVLRALSGIAGGTVVAQAVLMGLPLAVAFLGGTSTETTSVFVTAALFRAPYLIALGLALPAMAAITAMFIETPNLLIQRARLFLLFNAVMALGGAVAAYMIGPWLVPAIFGSSVELAGGPMALIAFGSLVALGVLFFTLVLIAAEATFTIAMAWGVALTVGVVPALLVDGAATATALSFMAAEVVALAVLAGTAFRSLDLRVRTA